VATWIAAVLMVLSLAPEAVRGYGVSQGWSNGLGVRSRRAKGGRCLSCEQTGTSESRRLMLPRSNEPKCPFPPSMPSPAQNTRPRRWLPPKKPAGESADSSNGREAASEAPATEPPPSPPIVSPLPHDAQRSVVASVLAACWYTRKDAMACRFICTHRVGGEWQSYGRCRKRSGSVPYNGLQGNFPASTAFEM